MIRKGHLGHQRKHELTIGKASFFIGKMIADVPQPAIMGSKGLLLGEIHFRIYPTGSLDNMPLF